MKLYISLVMLITVVFGCMRETQNEALRQKYETTWESLANHKESPRWFADAKFGIYFHWGVYSVPAYHNEWYPRWMHFEGHRVYKHHIETYGHPSEFGYHNFVPLFKAEKFNADAWAELFHQAGARFAGPVAEHHDGFSMWDSDVTPWNAMDKGPKKDITGQLKEAIEKKNMKFITTFHHARNLQRYTGMVEEEMQKEDVRHRFRNSHYPLFPEMPPAQDDPELNYLYGNIPENKWLEEIWFGKLKEVIHKYSHDIIWFDSWLDQIPEKYRQEFCAYYLNYADSVGKEVVIVRKQDDLPLDVSVDDLEKSRKNEIGKKVWMTDETISKGSWCYTEGLEIKPAKDVLHVLIDIVSKNGVLLLNISPKADGTIPKNQREVLQKIGDWLEKNGEAIYGTRPWYTYGEGPVKEPEGHFKNAKKFLEISYSEKDIRYTKKENTLYAMLLGVPQPISSVFMKAFQQDSLPNGFQIKNINLIGYSGSLDWELKQKGLQVNIPAHFDAEMATVFRIKIRQ